MGLVSEFLKHFYWSNRKTIWLVLGAWAALVAGCIGWLIRG